VRENGAKAVQRSATKGATWMNEFATNREGRRRGPRRPRQASDKGAPRLSEAKERSWGLRRSECKAGEDPLRRTV